MEIENDGVDGEATALISKIRQLCVYSIIYGLILIPVTLLWGGNSPFREIAWALCGVFICGAVWAYCAPSKGNLLLLGIVHGLAAPYGVWSGIYALCVSIIFAVIYFMRFSDVRESPITAKDLHHIRELAKQCKPQKPGDMIRIKVITLVDRRIWKCVVGEEQLLIHNRYRDELHVGRREDVRILGSNINKPRLNVRFTLRLNGEIYRCKTGRIAYHKLDRWIEDGRWEIANRAE